MWKLVGIVLNHRFSSFLARQNLSQKCPSLTKNFAQITFLSDHYLTTIAMITSAYLGKIVFCFSLVQPAALCWWATRVLHAISYLSVFEWCRSICLSVSSFPLLCVKVESQGLDNNDHGVCCVVFLSVFFIVRWSPVICFK